MAQPAIEINNLSFAYPGGNVVLDIETLKIRRGEHVFLHGPSGCGKTTLLGLITGVLPLQQGRLSILGEDVGKLAGAQRDAFRGAHMGYIFQMFNLIPYLNVRENIELPCKVSKVRKGRALRDESDWVRNLAMGLGIENLLQSNVTELSVGQQQRVAAARALAGHPELIICDEPTSALDLDRRKDFIRLLFEQAERYETSILFVSHDHSLTGLFHRAVALSEINRGGSK